MEDVTKRCIVCLERKSVECFSSKGEKRQDRSSYCRPCDAQRTADRRAKLGRPRGDAVRQRIRELEVLERHREERRTGTNLAKHVLLDCRKSDRKRNQVCDLTREFVEEALRLPCFYCGETDARLGLDRIDNDLGHTMDNVNTCCLRCNLTRADMPYGAWLIVAKGMREAREAGEFGTWRSKGRKRSTIATQEAITELKAEASLARVNDPLITAVGGKAKVSDEDMRNALLSATSIAAGLRSLGMADRGKNYQRAKRLLGIPVDKKLKPMPHTKQDTRP